MPSLRYAASRILLIAVGGFVVLVIAAILLPESGDTAASPPTATPRPTAPQPFTFDELHSCDRLRAKLEMDWGQSPWAVGSGDPRSTGNIERGDSVRLLMPRPNPDGLIRVKVFPHDGRAVGYTNDEVWVDWGLLDAYGLDRLMFDCER